MDLNGVVKLVISILASFAAGGIGSLFAFEAIPTWYAGLKKPPYTPPNWAFGPVWTTLYILMVISVFLVWQNGLTTNGVLLAFTLFWIQLVLNALWSIIFFGMKSSELPWRPSRIGRKSTLSATKGFNSAFYEPLLARGYKGSLFISFS